MDLDEAIDYIYNYISLLESFKFSFANMLKIFLYVLVAGTPLMLK
jgi:hypothetical protein